MFSLKPTGFARSHMSGFSAASSFRSRGAFLGIEGAAQNPLYLSGIRGSIPPAFWSSIIRSGVTRSHSVPVLGFLAP